MAIDYNNRWFRAEHASADGDVNEQTVFHHHQLGDIVWATYEGGAVRFGTLLATADDRGHLDMRYQHVDADNVFGSGTCKTRPEQLASGRLVLHETWRWTTGGSGTSVLREVDRPAGHRARG